MQRCRFCDHQSPGGVERCTSCGGPLPLEKSDAPGNADEEAARAPADEFAAQVLDLMKRGRKVDAIRLYRQQRQVGLKEAKDAVEALAAEHGVSPQGRGCTAMLLIFAIAAMLLSAAG